MKISTILIALVTISFYSCSSNNKKTDISGTYVTKFKNEYSITTDTIILTASESSSQTYNIERRTGFNKVRNGKILPKQFKVAKWTTTYNTAKELLQETDLGKQISLSPDKQSLKLGDTEYQKVK